MTAEPAWIGPYPAEPVEPVDIAQALIGRLTHPDGQPRSAHEFAGFDAAQAYLQLGLLQQLTRVADAREERGAVEEQLERIADALEDCLPALVDYLPVLDEVADALDAARPRGRRWAWAWPRWVWVWWLGGRRTDQHEPGNTDGDDTGDGAGDSTGDGDAGDDVPADRVAP